MVASYFGRAVIVTTLADAGADLNLKNEVYTYIQPCNFVNKINTLIVF